MGLRHRKADMQVRHTNPKEKKYKKSNIKKTKYSPDTRRGRETKILEDIQEGIPEKIKPIISLFQ